ncbi:MAG: hypothetical protein AAFR68_16585 [Pseudomonadota bacterium]
MPDLTDGMLADIMERVEMTAQEIADNAGFSGADHDGGASEMRHGVRMFRMGMNRQLPSEWVPLLRQMQRESDPEYGEYMRLKEKFEGAA